MIGRTVNADTTTAPTASAAPMPILPMYGTPTDSSPAIATITISPGGHDRGARPWRRRGPAAS
jgi:hypothetical protein